LLGGVITLLFALKGMLFAALGLGPSYALVTVNPEASKGLHQVGVGFGVAPV